MVFLIWRSKKTIIRRDFFMLKNKVSKLMAYVLTGAMTFSALGTNAFGLTQRETVTPLLTKKNEENKPEIKESRSSIPVYVDAKSHTFSVTVIDVFLDEQGNETGRDIRDNYKAEYGTQVEAYA